MPCRVHISAFLRRCRIGVFQYVFLKIILTLSTLVMLVRARLMCEVLVATSLRNRGGPYRDGSQKTDTYDRGSLSFKTGYVYVTIITNVSQIIAMYCLVLFYHTLHSDLSDLKPLGKLMAIKAVVFLTFW